jgi:hypothetical protein
MKYGKWTQSRVNKFLETRTSSRVEKTSNGYSFRCPIFGGIFEAKTPRGAVRAAWPNSINSECCYDYGIN